VKIEIRTRYGVTPNDLLNNPTISLRAKGLYAYIQSKPDNWKFSVDRMAKQLKEGADAIRTAIKELENAGYLERHSVKSDGGKYNGYDYILYATPRDNRPREIPSTVNAHTSSNLENSKLDKERESSVKASLTSRDKQIILAYSRLEKLLGIKIETGARIANTGALEMMLDDGHSLDEIMKAAQKMKEKLLKEGKDPKWYINFKSLSKMIGILLTEDKKSKWR
jgi:predicted transcriptional regulator